MSASVFVAICMPFIFELSKSKGRLTYGDAGVVNYRHIMGIDREDGTRLLREAAPKLPIPAATPHIQSYLAILELGTYPPWADPSFGYQGTSTPIDLRRQLNRVHVVLRYYFDLYFVDLGGLTAGMLALLIGGDLRGFGQRFLKYRALWFPAFSGLALYALVRVEGRMLAGFTISLFTACAVSLGTITSNYSAKNDKGYHHLDLDPTPFPDHNYRRPRRIAASKQGRIPGLGGRDSASRNGDRERR